MRIDDDAGLTETKSAAEQRLAGLGVSPGIAIGPAYVGDGGELAVHESHIPEPEIDAERGRFAEAVDGLAETAAQAQDQGRQPSRIRRRGDRLPARRTSGDAVELAPGARRRRAGSPGPDQRRARGRDRDRRDREELRRDARPLSGGADRGYPRRRHAAHPQPDQKALRRLFGRAGGRDHPRRRADPGRHRADGSAADRRLRRPVRRRRQPHRDRRPRLGAAGGARGAGPDRACAGGGDGGDRRHRRHRDPRSVEPRRSAITRRGAASWCASSAI